MNRRMVIYVTGRVTFVIGLLMILPILVALIYQEGSDTIYPLFQAMVCTLAIGAVMALRPPKRRSIYVREGLAITGLSWILLVVFGSLPYIFTGAIPSVVDAIFESASGFTTTGSSILSDIESLPHSILFWRNFTNFLGGMGVLVFAVALLPKSSSEDIHILKSEMPGPTFDKVMSRISEVARVFYLIYAALTLILIAILIGAGMSPFDAILQSFATAGTGGFSNHNTSIAAFQSVPIEIILAFGMLTFAVNFNLYFYALRGRWREALKSDELHWFVCIVVAAVAAIFINILPTYDNMLVCLKDAFFNVATIITTTGFGTVDFCQWPMFSQLVLLMLMFIGGCAGSTAGGLKISRVIALVKLAGKKLRQAVNPKRVSIVIYENKPMHERTQNDIALYFILYVFIFFLLVLMISFENLDFTTTFTAVATTFNNVGPGLGSIGPTGNFSGFSDFSKCVLTFGMVAGRLEIVPLILLFAPSTWRA